MSLFRRHRHTDDAGAARDDRVPGLPAFARDRGWQPADQLRPFDGHLESIVTEVDRAAHHADRTMLVEDRLNVGQTLFSDAWKLDVNGRDVRVANAWLDIHSLGLGVEERWHGLSVVAVELPTLLPLSAVVPRQFRPWIAVRPVPTGDPLFDDRFQVMATPAPDGSLDVLSPEMRRLLLGHDDWFLVAERYWLALLGRGAFREVAELTERIGVALDLVAAIPAAVMPTHVDHAQDDLVRRIDGLKSLEDAMAFFQTLTPDDRRELAASDSPLARFADVSTPQEAMLRFRQLDPPTKMQLMAMFMRVRDDRP